MEDLVSCFCRFLYSVFVCVCLFCSGELRMWFGIQACPLAVNWPIRPSKRSAERWSRRRWGEPNNWCCSGTPWRWDAQHAAQCVSAVCVDHLTCLEFVCVCVSQKQEEKKSAGPQPARNHQQRLENIVKQTTVETRVRHQHTCTCTSRKEWAFSCGMVQVSVFDLHHLNWLFLFDSLTTWGHSYTRFSITAFQQFVCVAPPCLGQILHLTLKSVLHKPLKICGKLHLTDLIVTVREHTVTCRQGQNPAASSQFYYKESRANLILQMIFLIFFQRCSCCKLPFDWRRKWCTLCVSDYLWGEPESSSQVLCRDLCELAVW